MTEYNILARVKIDGTEADAYFKKPRNLPVTVKATDVDKLSTTLGKIDNQLAKIKITNKDAFSNSQSVRDSYNETVRFRNALEKGTVTQGQYQVQFGKTNNEIARYNEQARTTINNTDNFASSIGKAVTKIALWGVATGLLYGSLKRIQEGVQYIKDLNVEMTNIGLVSGQTTSQMSGMATQFNDMAKDLGATTLDMAEGATQWIRQGKSAADTMELLRVSTMLSKLGDLEAAEATEKLTAVMNGYRLETEDAIKVTDTLIALDNSLATSTKSIADGMSKASSMANSAGVSFQNLATYIGVVQSITQQSGDTVGQAFKTMFARFQQVKAGSSAFVEDGEVEDINNVEKALHTQGIEIRDSAESFRELDDVLPEVAAKYKELMAAGKDVAARDIAGAIGGVRQINMIETLLQNWDVIQKSQTEVADNMGLTSSRYTIYLDSIEAKSNELKASMEEMWSKAISDDLIKNIIEAGTGVLKLVDNLGGLIPVLTAIAAAIIAIKWSTISASLGGIFLLVSNLGPAFTALAGRILFATGVTNTFAASQTAMAASTALATGGISILVAGLVLLLMNLDKIIPSMTTLNEKFQELKTDTDENVNELNSLSEEYENLANKAEKSSDDLARLLDIQTILNTKYGAAKDGINTYTSAIDGNSLAIQENIRWMKERAELEASNFIEENKREYEKAKQYLESPQKDYLTSYDFKRFFGTPEEMLSELNKRISSGEENIDTTTRQENLQKEISAAQQLIIDYDHYNNILKANTDAINQNNDAGTDQTAILDEVGSSSKKLIDNIQNVASAMEAVSKASSEQSKEGQISYSTALDLISANASLAQYLTQTADGYIFDAEAAKLATFQEMQNAFAKYNISSAAVAAANGNYIFAQSAIASANATEAEKTALYGLLKTFAAMNVKVSLPSGGGSGVSAQEKLNTLKKEAYQQEIKAVNAQKKAAQDEIKALQDKKDAFNDIIDAQKESLRLTKEENDYQKELQEKNKELADIDAELIQLQFDNSEEGNARRLELEEQRAEKTADIAEYQADRTYDIQIEALDREADAYEKMIDMQIAGVQTMIDGYDSVIAKINEMIDALSKAASAASNLSGGGGSVATPTKGSVIGPTGYDYSKTTIGDAEKAAKRDLNGNGVIGFDSGGSFETNSSGLIKVHPNEVGAILNKKQISDAAPFASFLSSIIKNSGTPQISSNNVGVGGVSIGDIQISVAGNLDKTVLPDLKEMIMKTITDATRNTGTLRNAKSFSV